MSFLDFSLKNHCATMMIKALFWLHSQATRRRKVIMEPQASSGLSKVSCVCRSLSRGIFGHVKPLCRRFAMAQIHTIYCLVYILFFLCTLPGNPSWQLRLSFYISCRSGLIKYFYQGDECLKTLSNEANTPLMYISSLGST